MGDGKIIIWKYQKNSDQRNDECISRWMLPDEIQNNHSDVAGISGLWWKKVMQNEDFDHFEPVFCGPEPWKKLYHKPTIKTSLFTISLKNQRCLQDPSLRCHMFFKIVDCNSNLTQLYFYLMFCILLKSLWISRKQCTVYHGSS